MRFSSLEWMLIDERNDDHIFAAGTRRGDVMPPAFSEILSSFFVSLRALRTGLLAVQGGRIHIGFPQSSLALYAGGSH